MQCCKLETKPGLTLLFIEIFKDAKDVNTEIIENIFELSSTLHHGKNEYTISISFRKGNYEIIGLEDEITEEQAKELIKNCYNLDEKIFSVSYKASKKKLKSTK